MTPTNGMEKLLNTILEDSDETDRTFGKVAQVQIVFFPGNISAGILRKGPIEGTFALGTLSQATENTPGDFEPGQMVMLEQFFEPSAIQSVMRVMPTGSSLVVPEGGSIPHVQ